MAGVPGSVYLCDQAQLTREGNHFVLINRSNGQAVGGTVYTYDALLSLANQAVRAVTEPPSASVEQIPRDSS